MFLYIFLMIFWYSYPKFWVVLHLQPSALRRTPHVATTTLFLTYSIDCKQYLGKLVEFLFLLTSHLSAFACFCHHFLLASFSWPPFPLTSPALDSYFFLFCHLLLLASVSLPIILHFLDISFPWDPFLFSSLFSLHLFLLTMLSLHFPLHLWLLSNMQKITWTQQLEHCSSSCQNRMDLGAKPECM